MKGCWQTRATKLSTDLGTTSTFVRGRVPVPFQQEVESVETLKNELELHGATLLFLRLIVREGLQPVAAIKEGSKVQDTDAAAAAEAVASVTPGDTAAEDIRNAVADLRAKAAESGLPRTAAAGRAPAATLEALRLQVVAVSVVAWMLWGALSVLSGAVLLVFQNPGFGTPMDYAMCIAWGAGITLAGQQAAQMTPTTVATAIGVKIPGK